jgi:Major Facilitator Superfamily.
VSVAETPVFTEVTQQRKPLKAPVLDAIRRHPRSFLVVIGSRMAENGLGYLIPVFGLNYVVQQLQLPKSEALFGVILSQFLSLFTIPLFSALSDRLGRRPIYLGRCAVLGGWAFPFFILCETKEPWLIWLAFVGASAIGVSGMFGPQAAYYSELFGPRVRLGGFAFARELGSILAGGPAAVSGNVASRRGWRQTLVGRRLHHRAFADHGSGDHHRTGDAPWRHCRRASR